MEVQSVFEFIQLGNRSHVHSLLIEGGCGVGGGVEFNFVENLEFRAGGDHDEFTCR